MFLHGSINLTGSNPGNVVPQWKTNFIFFTGRPDRIKYFRVQLMSLAGGANGVTFGNGGPGASVLTVAQGGIVLTTASPIFEIKGREFMNERLLEEFGVFTILNGTGTAEVRVFAIQED